MREIKNAIQMGHFGNLAALAAQIPDGDKSVHVIGYVLGKASGVTFRANPNGSDPSRGLTGTFEATPTEAGRAVMVAPTIFLPTSFVETISVALLKGKEAEIPKKAPAKGKGINVMGIAEIPLALEIGIRKNTGAGVGYEFAVGMINDKEPQAQDALGDLRAFLPEQIAQHSAPQLPAPAKGKVKGKGKSK